jgi:hypothetical protein
MTSIVSKKELRDLFNSNENRQMAIVRISFDIYTNSLGGGSQTLDVQVLCKNHMEDNDEYIEKYVINAYKKANLLPSHLFLVRKFDSMKMLETHILGKVAMTEIEQKKCSGMGLGGFIRSSMILFDMDTVFENAGFEFNEMTTLAQEYEKY